MRHARNQLAVRAAAPTTWALRVQCARDLGSGCAQCAPNQGLKFPIYRPIYRISAYSEAIFATENHLEEKSKKIGKCRLYRYRTEISMSKTHARVADFLLQNIEDISEISVKYRRYIGNIGKNIGDISEISGYIGDISGYIGNISK